MRIKRLKVPYGFPFQKPIEVRNLPLCITVFEVRIGHRDEYELVIVATVEDTDTGAPTQVRHSTHISKAALDCRGQDYFEHLVYDDLRACLLHELDEAFHIDAVRVRDPHKCERGRA